MQTSKYQNYPPLDPVPTGMKGRCPRCGEGNLFTGLLTVKKQCSACHLSFDFEDSGDGPTVFIIMGLGFLILGLALNSTLAMAGICERRWPTCCQPGTPRRTCNLPNRLWVWFSRWNRSG